MPKVIDLLCKSHRDSHESRLNQSGTHANYLGLISIGMRNNKAPYTKRGRDMRPPTKGSFAPGGVRQAQDPSEATLRSSVRRPATSVAWIKPTAHG